MNVQNDSAESRSECVAREDLVMFVNACFACSGQREFYTDATRQAVSIEFLHQYILGNYRRLYARTLAAGINHFNQQQIVFYLLSTGSQTPATDRDEENALITKALKNLPPQRVFRLFEMLRDRRVNNRRTRAVMKRYLQTRRDPHFDAVKYRNRIRMAVTHAHLKLQDEIGAFLFEPRRKSRFETPLFEDFRQAHYSQEAVYRLPFTIAEGLAAKHQIPRDVFLKKIEAQMTKGERFRLQKSSLAQGHRLDVDLSVMPLSRLAIFICSMEHAEREKRKDELDGALDAATQSALGTSAKRASLGKVVGIFDRSFSSSGTQEKKRRPLAMALATLRLLSAASQKFFSFWTPHLDKGEKDFLVNAAGQTDLATPLLAALRLEPDLVVIVSDGYENAPTGAATQIVRAFRERIPGAQKTSIIHLNPVFDAEHYAPKVLGPDLPTVGIRDAEDLFTMIGFARFAEGSVPLQELEAYLSTRADLYLSSSSSTKPSASI